MNAAIILSFCRLHGHGRAIQIIQEDWSAMLQEQYKLPVQSADSGAGLICAWCGIDHRTGKQINKAASV